MGGGGGGGGVFFPPISEEGWGVFWALFSTFLIFGFWGERGGEHQVV